MANRELSWRNPSLDHSIDKWKMQRRFLLQKVMCKQEWFSSKAEGSILHIHPFSCCFGLFYQQRGKKRMLIKSADDPKIEGAEISRKAGPRVQLNPEKRSARLHVQHEEHTPKWAGQMLLAQHWNQKGQCGSCTSPLLYTCFRLSLHLMCLLRTELVGCP